MPAIPPPDEIAHTDGRLMHDTAAMNNRLALYIVGYFDADAGRKPPISIADELRLAEDLISIGESLRARAERREHAATPRT